MKVGASASRSRTARSAGSGSMALSRAARSRTSSPSSGSLSATEVRHRTSLGEKTLDASAAAGGLDGMVLLLFRSFGMGGEDTPAAGKKQGNSFGCFFG